MEFIDWKKIVSFYIKQMCQKLFGKAGGNAMESIDSVTVMERGASIFVAGKKERKYPSQVEGKHASYFLGKHLSFEGSRFVGPEHQNSTQVG